MYCVVLYYDGLLNEFVHEKILKCLSYFRISNTLIFDRFYVEYRK